MLATVWSTRSAARPSVKQPANRATNPIARSVAPSSIAPASEVILPPSKAATTARPSTGTNPNKSALHSVRIGLPLPPRQTVLATRFSQIQGPDAPTPFEKSGLAELAQQADRVRQTLDGGLESLACPPDDGHRGKPPIQESPGVGEVPRVILEPIKQGGGIDGSQRNALRIKAEIGRAVPGTVPGGVNRLVQQA